jgi:hypothetical protein
MMYWIDNNRWIKHEDSQVWRWSGKDFYIRILKLLLFRTSFWSRKSMADICILNCFHFQLPSAKLVLLKCKTRLSELGPGLAQRIKNFCFCEIVSITTMPTYEQLRIWF